jgi:hypothetical protein
MTLANANGGCVPYVQTRGAFAFAFTNRWRFGYGESSHPRACARARLHALGRTREWDGTMGRSRWVTIVYVYASRRASAPLGPEAALDVDIDNHGA